MLHIFSPPAGSLAQGSTKARWLSPCPPHPPTPVRLWNQFLSSVSYAFGSFQTDLKSLFRNLNVNRGFQSGLLLVLP